jgi:NAD(P)-dependent dehydrogenase (short-subunit alcohol dehydrogenase family)/ribulose-5-phosphate 4-epimerase/fuculose-1-phosphate aldolase
MGFVRYIMPGFGLAKESADVFEQNPNVEGLILDKHGLFTFGDSAREAYERMIEMVTLAEERLAKNRKAVFVGAALPNEIGALAEIAPILRGATALPDPKIQGAWKRLILEFRTSDAILNFVNGDYVARYACAGVITPDHTIRTKNWPMIAPAPDADRLAEFRDAARETATAFAERYRTYFARNNDRVGGIKTMLDPAPRVILVPGQGLFGLGRTRKDARVAADLAEAAVEAITEAEAIGQFSPIGEEAMFDVEYWSLEQAKLGGAKDLPLAGQIAVITGAAGAIGFATAKAFAAAGAEIALLDIDGAALVEAAKAFGGTALSVRCDVTDDASVRAAFDRIAETFGGIDILVSNAGAAFQGRIGSVDDATLRQSFELNFFSHQRVAQNAVRIMLAQGIGGCLLFNASKQAINPGPDFGPYGLPKAATLFLARQYALDHGADGIRANAVNADRIRSGLLTGDFIADRAKARGVSEADYMAGNLLRREVTAEDVAQAFLHQALALKTTADVTTVDGGNIAAALR